MDRYASRYILESGIFAASWLDVVRQGFLEITAEQGSPGGELEGTCGVVSKE